MTTEPTDLENVATLHLEVWDRDKMSKDDFMGQCEVVLEHSFLATCHNRPQCKSLELQPRSGRKKDKVRGCVVVRITYWSPATLRKLKFQEGGGASHTLQVIVVKGEKLVAKDANGKSDPFFKARWVGGVGTLSPEVKSTVIPRTLNPNWSHAAAQAGTDEPMLKCTVDTIDDLPRLEVEVWDRDIGSEDDFMGYVAADFDPEVLRQNDGRWWMESLILGPRESAPSRLSKRISSASLAASSPLSPRHSAPTVERSSAHASGRVFVKIQYTSPQASRMKIRKSCSSRMMLAESPQLELRFETADEHPLVIMCSLEQSLYESTVNALYSGVVTRAHSRKAITYQSSFEGSDAVEVVLLHVQSHPDWRYERVRRFFEDEACKEEIIDRFDATHLERCRQYLITNTLGEKSWSRDDAVALLQRMLDDRYFRRCTAGDSVFKDAKTLYSFESPGLKDLEALRKRTGIKSIGRAMKSEKCTPRFPVVLVPGLASTALEVWDSEEAPEWLGERVWIDVNKIGSLAQVQKVKNMLRSSKKSDDDSAPGVRPSCRHLFSFFSLPTPSSLLLHSTILRSLFCILGALWAKYSASAILCAAILHSTTVLSAMERKSKWSTKISDRLRPNGRESARFIFAFLTCVCVCVCVRAEEMAASPVPARRRVLGPPRDQDAAVRRARRYRLPLTRRSHQGPLLCVVVCNPRSYRPRLRPPQPHRCSL
eukprot:TRINITY_DN5186_c0_g1_i1.p1 TRINITY_DN5186_c0_g1~~TRINITY_DN5186_c0_g1_i1.p1  ORF type:complete len:780 (-),score=156.48 TRINITY_DN5186_c0_g1_i1:1224-3356(-)